MDALLPPAASRTSILADAIKVAQTWPGLQPRPFPGAWDELGERE